MNNDLIRFQIDISSNYDYYSTSSVCANPRQHFCTASLSQDEFTACNGSNEGHFHNSEPAFANAHN